MKRRRDQSPEERLAYLLAPWADLTQTERRARRDYPHIMRLTGSASSPQAQALVEDLLTRVVFPAKLASGQLRPSSRRKLTEALGAFLGDLLAAANGGRWLAGSTRRNSFTGKPIGEKAFADVRQSLQAAGLLVHVDGHSKDKVFSEGKPISERKQWIAPVFRATVELLELAAAHGVEAVAVGRHFTFAPEDRQEA